MLLRELLALLESDDIRGSHLMNTRRADLEATNGSARFAFMEHAIQRFDYREAMRLLQETA